MTVLEQLVSLEKSLDGLPSIECLGILGKLEQLRAVVWVRVITAPSHGVVTGHTDNLLTIPQVAERLAIPETRAYELSRQGRLPTIKIGKYLRVDPKELELWIKRLKDLDLGLYSTDSYKTRDRNAAQTSTKAAGPDPSRSSRGARSSREHAGSMGKRGASNKRADLTADPIAVSDEKGD